jgi:trimeric autotransporter adhesin
MFRKLLLLVLCASATTALRAQSFSINTDGSAAHASAALDVKSTAKGVLIPRMSKAQKNAIASPATGLIIFRDAPCSIVLLFVD